VTLPDDVKAKLLPAEQYANAKPVQDHAAWEQSPRPCRASGRKPS
jgi:putative spermidine/putrescine transport system substrate-binding protein